MSRSRQPRSRRQRSQRQRQPLLREVGGSFQVMPPRKPVVEELESRHLMAIVASFNGTASILAGTDVNVSRASGSQTEVHVAVNPLAPGNAVLLSNGGLAQDGVLSQAQFVAMTKDAGVTWQKLGITTTQDGRDATERFDGATAIDDFGNVHVVYMRRPTPAGSNDIIYARSIDGGLSFTDFRVIAGGADVDKPWIAVGPHAGNPNEQAVWVTFSDETGGNQRVFATGATVAGLGAVGAFAANVQINDAGGSHNYAVPAVGPNGQFVVSWMSPSGGQGPASLRFDRDLDGLTNGITFGTDQTIVSSQVGGEDMIPATPERGTFASPYVMYDRSGGAFNGRLYVAYADESPAESNNLDIYLQYSTDNGTTWNTRVKANDDATTTSQFFQAISVDQVTGAVWLSWYDARNDAAANTQVRYYATASLDGGASFLPNVAVSDGPSAEATANPNQNDFGDYTGIAAYGGTAYATWADNSNSTSNVVGTSPGVIPFEIYADRLRLNWSSGQTITVTGTGAADQWLLQPDSSGQFLQIYNGMTATGKPAYTATLAAVTSIVIQGSGGNDTIFIKALGTNFTGTISVDGGAGADELYDLQGAGTVSNVESILRTTISATGQPAWVEQGPGPAQGGLVAGMENKPVTGAVQSILIDPANAQQIFLGTVNGGVWRTKNGGLTWEPLTDNLPSPSISQLVFDEAESPRTTLYAATGKTSSYMSSGLAVGILKGVLQPDGSYTWTVIRRPEFERVAIHDLHIRGANWLVATDNGVYRSTDSGNTFELMQGFRVSSAAIQAAGTGYVAGQTVNVALNPVSAQIRIDSVNGTGGVTGVTVIKRGVSTTAPTNPVSTTGGSGTGLTLNLTLQNANANLPIATGIHDLAADPGNANRFFVGAPGSSAGVYLTNDGGATFTAVNSGLDLARAQAIRVAVSEAIDPVTSQRPVYAAVIREASGTLTAAVAAGVNTLQLNSVAAFTVGDVLTTNFGATGAGGASLVESRTITALNRSTNQVTLSSNLSNAVGNGSVVYVLGKYRVSNLYRSADLGATWTAMGAPGDEDGGVNWGGQALKHFSMLPDRTNPNVIFVGGDAQPTRNNTFPNLAGATNYTGRLFRGALSGGTTTWEPITDAGADPDTTGPLPGTGPHADSRHMVFDAAGNILQADDGGIYKLTNPNAASPTRLWSSLNGNLRVTEVTHVAYDSIHDLLIVGTQDNGVSRQDAPNSYVWSHLIQGDGRVVQSAVVDGVNVWYGSAQRLGQFKAFSGLSTVGDFRDLKVNGTGPIESSIYQLETQLPFTTIWTLNEIDPKLLLIGTTNFLYEEDPDTPVPGDPGDDLTLQNGSPVLVGTGWGLNPRAAVGEITALAYGGRERDAGDALVDKPRVGYAAAWDRTPIAGHSSGVGRLRLRVDLGQDFIEIPSWVSGPPNGAYIRDIVMHPHNWRKLYVVDYSNRVWLGEHATGDPNNHLYNWTNLTNNLGDVAGNRAGSFDDELNAVEVVIDPGPTPSSSDDQVILLVGGRGGVFRATAAGTSTHWSKFGTGIPNVRVMDLDYNAADDLLVVGTLGRGAFKMERALDSLKLPSTLIITGANSDEAWLLKLNPARPWQVDVYAHPRSIGLPAFPITTLDLTGIDSMVFNLGGGSDQVTLDATNGLLFLPGGITIQGGTGTDILTFQNPSSASASGLPAGGPFTNATWSGLDGFGEARTTKITFTSVEDLTSLGAPPPAPASTSASGLGFLGHNFNSLLNRSLIGRTLPFFNLGTLGRGLGGRVFNDPAPLGFPKGVVVDRVSRDGWSQVDTGESIFDRILALGLTGIDFTALAANISSPTELVAYLDGLDSTPGNVTFTQVGGTTTFNMVVEKALNGIFGIELDGSAILDSQNINDGQLTLEGRAEVNFNARLALTFGVDANGFFLQPDAGAPELKISNLTIDGSDLRAEGNYGFQAIEVDGATVTIDPLLSLNFDFAESAGELVDGKIRLPELLNLDAAGRMELSFESPGTQDLRVDANFAVLPVLPGLGALFAVNDTAVSIVWADLDSSTPVATTSNSPTGGGADLKNFLDVDPVELLAQFRELTTQLDQISANVDIDIPFIEQGFDAIVDLAQTFDERVVSPLFVNNGDPLSAVPKFDTIQALISSLSSSLNDLDLEYLIDLSNLGDFVNYDRTTKSVLFTFEFSKEFSLSDTLDMGFDLESGLADFDFSTVGAIDATLRAEVTLGIDLQAILDGDSPTEWLFLSDTSFTASIEVSAANIDAAARFGFLGIEVVDGNATINAAVTVALTDPGVGPAANDRVTIAEIIAGLSDPASLIDIDLTGSATLSLPISAPFLGIVPSADTTLAINWPDISDPSTLSVDLPEGLLDLGNFNNMDAGQFVSLLGQLTSFLGDFGNSTAFAVDVPLVGDVLSGILEASDWVRDNLLIDDLDDTDPGNDVPKLLTADNQPTFVTGTTRPWATVQELAQKLTEILGPGSPVTYDAATDSLLVVLTLEQNFGQLDVPLNFNLDFAPLGNLESEGSLELSANGELTITLGIYLGNEGGQELTTSTPLASLKDGAITFNKNLVVVPPTDVKTVYGQLTDDAVFSLSVDGGAPVEVTVTKGLTTTNTTATDLANDIDAVLVAAGLGASVQAVASGNRLSLRRVGDTGSLAITAANGTPAVTQLGFRNGQTAALTDGQLKLTAMADVASFVGRLSGPATFQVTMNTVNGNAPVIVTVPQLDTETNRNILDIVVDVQNAIDKATVGGVKVLKDKLQVSSVGRRLLLTAVAPATTSFSITATAGNPAITELGLATSNVGSGTDIVITTRNGQVHNVSFDSLPASPTLGDVISAIETQTSGQVDVQFSDGNTRLRLIDTNSSGTTVFKVENAIGSLAANLLGIMGADVVDPDDPDEVRDYQFDGAPLGGVDLLDRLFITDASASVGFEIDTPAEGVTVAAQFGFVSVALAGDGHLEGSVTMGLTDPDPTDPDGRITLKELFDSLSDIDSLIATPQVDGFGSLEFGVTITPSFGLISTGASPTVTVTIHDIGDPFASIEPDIEVTTANFDQLADFDGIDFADILEALRALVDFLQGFEEFEFLKEPIPLINVSVNDMLSYAEDFADALDQVAQNPAATIQFLEQKLKEAFNIPQNSTLLQLKLVEDGATRKLKAFFEFGPRPPLSK